MRGEMRGETVKRPLDQILIGNRRVAGGEPRQPSGALPVIGE